MARQRCDFVTAVTIVTLTLIAAPGCPGSGGGDEGTVAADSASTGGSPSGPADPGPRRPDRPDGEVAPARLYRTAILVSVGSESLAGGAAGGASAEANEIRRDVHAVAAATLAGFAELVAPPPDEASLAERIATTESVAELRRALATLLRAYPRSERPENVIAVHVELDGGRGGGERVLARGADPLELFLSEPSVHPVRRPSDLDDATEAAIWGAMPIAATIDEVRGSEVVATLRLPSDPPDGLFGDPVVLVIDGPRGSRSGFLVGRPVAGGAEARTTRVTGHATATFASRPREGGRAVRVRLGAAERALEVLADHDGSPAAGVAVFAGPSFDALAFRGVTGVDGSFGLTFDGPRPLALSLRKTVSATEVDFGRTVVTSSASPLRLKVRVSDADIASLVGTAETRERALEIGRDAVLDGFGYLYDGELARAREAYAKSALALAELEKTGDASALRRQLVLLKNSLAISTSHDQALRYRDQGLAFLSALRYDDAVGKLDEAAKLWPENPKIEESAAEARRVADERETVRGQARATVLAAKLKPSVLITDEELRGKVIEAAKLLIENPRLVDRQLLDALSGALGTLGDDLERKANDALDEVTAMAKRKGVTEEDLAPYRAEAAAARVEAHAVIKVRREIDEAIASAKKNSG